MFNNCLEQMSAIYYNMDSILITNKDGIIEYSALFDIKDNSIKNEGYTGKYLLDVYPELTEETSTHFRVMQSGKPILDEIQTLTDWNGKLLTFSSSTYPIELEGEIIGAVEGTVILSSDGTPYNKRLQKQEKQTQKGESLYTLDDLIGSDPQMLEVKEQILRTAKSDSSIMVIGDTGTGKEVAAQAIHSHSPREDGPFVSQNCSAIPTGLLESILFGTAKGSYTGAEDRKGLFELADQGTLFLDELNSMEFELQGKILKAVEDQKIRRIGSETEKKIDVRIVSAVNQEPEEILKAKKLRKDLFYRLGVIQIRLPLLKDRQQDIPILIQHYIEFYNRRGGRKIKGCSQLAQQMLASYSWPGNIRELRNVIEYGFNMARGDVITVRDLPENLLYDKNGAQGNSTDVTWRQDLNAGKSLNDIAGEFEKEIIETILRENSNVTEAAAALHVSRQALRYKMMKYGLEK